jgi:hypothetical protein
LGVVYQPSWFHGFNVSFDYYRISISSAIRSFNATQLLNLCYAGQQDACSAITQIGTQNGLPVLQIISGPQNFASEISKGFDIESSYALPLNTINDGWAGNLNFRMLVTRALSDISTSGSPGTIPSESVGASVPKWRFQGSASYVLDPVTVGLTIRGISAGVLNNSWITCTSDCPASTANHITSDWNHIDGATYFDFNASYKISMGDRSEADLFFSVRNLTNKSPAIDYVGPNNSSYTFYPANNSNYDVLGRVFRAGVRFKM